MSMFRVNLNIGGISSLSQRLNATGQAVEAAKNAAIDAVAQHLRETIQGFAQAGHPSNPEVQTGQLLDSIQWSHIGDGLAQVYTNLDYAYWVEFGHSQEPGRFVPAIGARLVQSFVPAYPFFRPGITQVIDGGEATSMIRDYFQNAVENMDGGGGTGGSIATAMAEDVAAIFDL